MEWAITIAQEAQTVINQAVTCVLKFPEYPESFILSHVCLYFLSIADIYLSHSATIVEPPEPLLKPDCSHISNDVVVESAQIAPSLRR